MRYLALVALAGVWLVDVTPRSAFGQAGGGPPFVDGEVLVAFRTAQAAGRSGAMRAAHRATLIGQFARSGIQHWRLPPGRSVEQAINTLAGHPDIKYCEPNYWLQPMIHPNDPQIGQSWALENQGQTGGTVDADIDAPEAWDQSTGDDSVIVAVIDTGIDVHHPDLADNIWTNPAECPGGVGTCVANGVDEDGNGYIDDFHGWDFLNGDNSIYDDGFLIGDSEHGTHVTGIMAARGDNGVGMAGVNWQVNVIACKFIGLFGGPVSAAIEAIEYASAKGARVVNASWGGTGPSMALKDAIETSGVVFVAAAGNDGTDNDVAPVFPASFDSPNLIAVAATDHNDRRASFSNWGATTVDLGAPGAGIFSTTPNGTYGFLSGTSMAAPHVSGVAALVLSLSPDLTPVDVKGRILDGVDSLTALAGATVTGGRLNAAASLGPDTVGPFVVDSHPTGPTSAGVDRIHIAFNEAINVSTFTPVDVVSFVGPSGPIGVAGVDVVAGSGAREFEITFSAQTELGDYDVVIGPDITDANGNPMADPFVSAFNVRPFVGRFDFGPDGAPVETGHAPVTPAHVYDVATGYGWQQGTVLSVDRFVGSKLIRDLDYGSDYVFAVDVPIGTYAVTLITGDTGIYPHDEMAVMLERVQVDTVSTLAGEVKTITYDNITVSDGQLTVRMTDLGGSTANAVINGLHVIWTSADTTGPRVIDTVPAGAVVTAVDRVTLTFNEPLAAGSFTPADVVSLTGPAGSMAPIAVTPLSSTRYDVLFAEQTAFGDYTLVVGPGIVDLSGNSMDQNGNGVGGEPVADRFSSTVTVVPPRFDFGVVGSVVESGFLAVVPSTAYDATTGFGWQGPSVSGVDRVVGTNLGKDLNYGPDMTFAVDVSNGVYSVTLTIGDTGIYPHDEMAILFEDVPVDIVSTAAGEVVTIVYDGVSVGDGQLRARIIDQGGGTANAVINGLDISPDATGPRVIAADPAGAVDAAIDHITLTFDEPPAADSFTIDDVVSLTGPAGAIAPITVTRLSATQFDVVFAEQAAFGDYTLVVGPDIEDLSGNPMDQNDNGINGEPVADQFVAAFRLVAFVGRFDFGTAASPVAGGYVPVQATNAYDPIAGFGWQAGTVADVDRPVGTPLDRDLNYGGDYTFAVDVPIGTYSITLTTGDTDIYPHDLMAVFLDQVQVDTVSTLAGEVKTIVYEHVTVSDGQLTVRMTDLGGTTANAVINGLDVVWVSGDAVGPQIIDAAPTGTVVGSIDHIALIFNEPIAAGSFTLADVTSLTGPLGAISPTGVSQSSDTQFDVTFAEQAALGDYSLVVGPDIVDLSGNVMAAPFGTIVTLAPMWFDFGVAGSAVGAGFLPVLPADMYDATLGFGWQSGIVAGVDRSVGTSVGKDLHYGPDMTFAVDVANDLFTVTLTIGDTGIYPHDEMAILLEQAQVDTIHTAPGEVLTVTYNAIAVVDGQLTLRVVDMGGSTGNAVINGLEIDVDRAGPRVDSTEPSGTVAGSIDSLTLTFNEPIAPGSFALDDIVSLTGPLGPIAPLAVTGTSEVRFAITFAEQNAGGEYAMVIGPDIFDVAGNRMDQNGNGLNGETVADQFETTLNVIEFLGRFDFGTAASPVADGYIAVRSTDTYDPIMGFGWLAGTVADVDRPVGTALGRDLNYGADFTFAVDVPDGTYTITLTIGDTGIYPHDLMAVSLEQIQVDVVDTAPGEIRTIVYDAVVVVDGQLTVRITDLGGTTGNAVINGLDVMWVGP